MGGKAGQGDGYVVYGSPGTGAVVVEAALTLLGQPYRVEEPVAWERLATSREMAAINPMRQYPVLRLPSGAVMTESAAILIWLGERHPAAGLAPTADDPRRAQYLRWLVFIATQIYALYWVRDDPARLAGPDDKTAQAVILQRSAERIAECWRLLGEQLRPAGRFLLGDEPTLLDVYMTIASRWTPRRRRFYEVAPHLAPVVRALDADPRLADLWARRMPFESGWEG